MEKNIVFYLESNTTNLSDISNILSKHCKIYVVTNSVTNKNPNTNYLKIDEFGKFQETNIIDIIILVSGIAVFEIMNVRAEKIYCWLNNDFFNESNKMNLLNKYS
ncbi:hypothetical protein Catovirus_1_739 [Catovirus CTV1]|uniref:Uncharacterized protein n=1 Tax=Catovirus CTV1 TaxID=1977631 RepID=A0A1V0SAG3_9VIRU|nr:hypothetical protein Catovirus_1_739 [Catovirus CTV1]